MTFIINAIVITKHRAIFKKLSIVLIVLNWEGLFLPQGIGSESRKQVINCIIKFNYYYQVRNLQIKPEDVSQKVNDLRANINQLTFFSSLSKNFTSILPNCISICLVKKISSLSYRSSSNFPD